MKTNAEIVRAACVKAYNMNLKEFMRLYSDCSSNYVGDKFRLMQRDFPRWFCSLDSRTAEKFMEETK